MTAAATNKAVYLHELRRKLKGLPESEVIAACAYYDEYLTEAGPENEAAAIAELGTPAEVAAGIMGDYVIKDTTAEEKSTRSGLSAIWIVVLGLFASPIALPLAIVLIAVIFSLLVAALAVIFSFFVAAFACLVAGIAYVGIGFYTLFFHAPTGILTIGSGLVAASIGGALGLAMIWLSKVIINGIARMGAGGLRTWKTRKEAS